jgi:hypothetical protein
MARTQARAYVPADVRRDLWIAAAGRCEFRGCCKRVDRDFLTKRAQSVIGEFAHIIADSPAGARGVDGESERLAKDPSNLMLTCFDCHGRIDRDGKSNEYSAEELRAMKRDHEARIEQIYSAAGWLDSLPILMYFPVGTQVPAIQLETVQRAMITNSGHTRFPSGKNIQIDRASFDVFDDSQEFWPQAQRSLVGVYEQQIRPLLHGRDAHSHLTIAAFAPIPLLMKLGALIGDKVEAMVLDHPGEGWLWDKRADCPAPQFTFEVPESLPREVAAVVSISNGATHPQNMVAVEFRALEPNRGIIRTERHLLEFRREFNAFLLSLARAGARVLHIHPATPLSASVEVGRLLLPKVFEEVHVWEWQAPQWKPAIRLK